MTARRSQAKPPERQPFRNMGKTCRSRTVEPKVVKWADITTPPYHGGRFVARQLRRTDIEKAAELWRAAYPETYGSSHEFILYPDQYEGLIALQDSWEEDAVSKKHCMPVVEELATGRLVAASLLTKEDKNLQIELTFLGTLPEYRGMQVTYGLTYMVYHICKESGAEYLTTFLETWHDITQKMIIQGGWKIAGIFPGNFTRWKGGDQEYRACTVHAYRFIHDGAEYATKPEEWNLAPEIKELWECLERINEKIASNISLARWDRVRQHFEG